MRVLLSALLLLAFSPVQQPPPPPPPPQMPPRDARPAAMAVGTGVLRGRVVAADTGSPIRRASVMLMGGPAGGPPTTVTTGRGGVSNSLTFTTAGPPRSVQTDETGSFEFAQLPPGSYRVQANPGPTRAEYLSVAYGSRDPMQPGRTVTLGEAQRVEDLEIRLPRAAVITGRVTDDLGDPVSRAQVFVLQARSGQMNRTGPGAQSDDRGEFRIFGLTPGTYVVAADQRSFGPPAEGETLGLITSYSPGTADPAGAMRVRVGPGQEASADIRMIRARLYTISGTVVNERGEPVTQTGVQVMRNDPFGSMMSTGASVDNQGRFVARNVAPGDYRLIVRSQPSGPSTPETVRLMATAPVRVEAADVDNVLLVLRPGAVVTGTISYDTPPASEVKVRVMTAPPDRFGMMFGGSESAQSDGDRFTLRNLFGPVLLRPSMPTQGWALKAVLLRGRDITDVPTELTERDSGHVEIVLTSRAPSIDGIVTDASGQPVGGGATVLAFGEDPATWSILRSSMMRTAPVRPDGTYRMPGLREGSYFVIALPQERGVNAFEPGSELLSALSKEATRVTVGADEQRKVDLRIAPGDGGNAP